MNRRLLIVLIPIALVAGVVTAGLVRHAQIPGRAPLATPLLAEGKKIDASLAGLIDASGQPVDEARFEGRHLLVAFGFTACPDVCPTTLFGVKQALEQLGEDAAGLAPVFVSVDPERDTPGRIGAYVGAFDERIVGLTGSVEAIEDVARRFTIYYRKVPLSEDPGAYTVDHSTYVFLIDPEHRIRALIHHAPPAQMAQEIVTAFRSLQQQG